jgi:hypothetical protein
MKKSNTTTYLAIALAFFFVSTLALIYTNYFIKKLEVVTNNISPTIQPISSVTITSDWKTYEDKERGFSFQYPRNIRIEDNGVFLKIGGDQLFNNIESFSLDKLHKQQKECSDFYRPDSSLKTTPNKTKYYSICDGYWILPDSQDIYIELKYIGTANQILSTFKFIKTSSSTQNKVGWDRDEHGCIGSAGYSWCELKQKCLRTFEEKCSLN